MTGQRLGVPIRQALPAEPTNRALIGQALRSLFRLLNARRLIFTNPTARIRTGRPETRDPLPVPISCGSAGTHVAIVSP